MATLGEARFNIIESNIHVYFLQKDQLWIKVCYNLYTGPASEATIIAYPCNFNLAHLTHIFHFKTVS